MREISKIRKKEIEELANFIANDYCPTGMVLPELIADASDLFYTYENYNDSFDGALEHVNGSFHIYLNNRSTLKSDNPRLRFSFAHELGHYFIDEHRNSLIKGISLHKSYFQYLRRNIVEKEADHFASNLLMPTNRFKRDVFGEKFNFKLINSLSKSYGVSITACAFRFSDIGNHPILIVYAEDNIIKWTKHSSDFPFMYLISRHHVSENTVMGEYFLGLNKDEVHKTEKVWAIDCFNYVSDNDIQRQFYEHCIPYKNRALSILWED